MKILVIAPHADDEIIGAGGTISKHVKKNDDVYVCVVTKGASPIFSKEFVDKIRKETLQSHQKIGVKKTFFLEFPSVILEKEDSYIINKKIDEVIQHVKPDEVFIPHIGDMHKDHRIVAEAAMVCLRPKYEHVIKRIYAYETLSETGWNIPNVINEFIPNYYVDISDYLDKKLEAMKCYESQLGSFPDARSLETIEVLAKYRGSTMNLKAAEAFMLIRGID
ncbi:MAG: PIG-L family deacetylase [Clostridia bacterium]|nr:PIG-L family deacetylase [Clostridia bacterium]